MLSRIDFYGVNRIAILFSSFFLFASSETLSKLGSSFTLTLLRTFVRLHSRLIPLLFVVRASGVGFGGNRGLVRAWHECHDALLFLHHRVQLKTRICRIPSGLLRGIVTGCFGRVMDVSDAHAWRIHIRRDEGSCGRHRLAIVKCALALRSCLLSSQAPGNTPR
jgi:hypothetical protein